MILRNRLTDKKVNLLREILEKNSAAYYTDLDNWEKLGEELDRLRTILNYNGVAFTYFEFYDHITLILYRYDDVI